MNDVDIKIYAASHLPAKQKREIRVNCRKFYKTAVNQFQTSFIFNGPTLNFANYKR